MPELPEVETVRRELAPWLVGRRVRRTVLCQAEPGPKYADLGRAAGHRIDGVGRRGKFLLLPLSGGLELVIHLGMTGVLSARRPPRHLRVMLELSGARRRRLYFRDARRFGRMLVVAAGDYRGLPTLARMGPEPLGADFDRERFARALDSAAAIKPLLLSQRPVAGLGNIYADEALWRARIHPRCSGRSLSRRKVGALHAAIVAVLRASLAGQGTTFSDYRTVSGAPGRFSSELAVYGRAGERCGRCGGRIARIVVAGRGTHLCMRCQRWPRRGA